MCASERERESCRACLLDGESRPGRKSEPEETPTPASPTRAAAVDGGQGRSTPGLGSWTQERRGWLVGQCPMHLLSFFLGTGFLQGTMTLSLSKSEVQSSRQRSSGHREMQ